MSITVQVPKRVHPRQIEFGPNVERSKKGALYFVPGSTKTITDQEYEFLVENHKAFAQRLIVVARVESKKQSEAKTVEAANAPKRAKDKPSQAKQRAEQLLKKKEQIKVAKTDPAAATSQNIVKDTNVDTSVVELTPEDEPEDVVGIFETFAPDVEITEEPESEEPSRKNGKRKRKK